MATHAAVESSCGHYIVAVAVVAASACQSSPEGLAGFVASSWDEYRKWEVLGLGQSFGCQTSGE